MAKWKKIVLLIGAGLLSVVPIVMASWLLEVYSISSTRSQLNSIAERMVTHAETAIDEGVTAIADLAEKGIRNCSPIAINTLRNQVYRRLSLKDIAVTNAIGNLSCGQLGVSPEIRRISDDLEGQNKNLKFTAIEFIKWDTSAIMVRWDHNGNSGLAAIIASGALSTNLLPTNEAVEDNGVAHVVLKDGTILASVNAVEGKPRQTQPGDLVGTLWSERYPIGVTLAISGAYIRAQIADLQIYAMLAGVIMGATLLLTAIQLIIRDKSIYNDIERGIRRGEFVPYYQPVIDLQKGELAGCEVLVRWRKPTGQVLAPWAFIDLAESTGLALPMTISLMKQVRDELGPLYKGKPHMKVAINLFYDHFSDLDIIDDVEEIFKGADLSFEHLVFEVTERYPLNDFDMAARVIEGLQGLGCRVALDDAGTGHSGLANMQKLNMDFVKIDKLFIDTISEDGPPPTPIIGSLVDLAQKLNMWVVAEGVESYHQVPYLQELGVQFAQGYLFAPPLPGESFVELIKASFPDAVATENEASSVFTPDLEAPLAEEPGEEDETDLPDDMVAALKEAATMPATSLDAEPDADDDGATDWAVDNLNALADDMKAADAKGEDGETAKTA